MQIDMYGFSYSGHTLLPTLLLLNLNITVRTRQDMVARKVYNDTENFQLMRDVVKHWNSTTSLRVMERLGQDWHPNATWLAPLGRLPMFGKTSTEAVETER